LAGTPCARVGRTKVPLWVPISTCVAA